MTKLIIYCNIINTMIHNDAPTSKQILFQDPATEAAEGIIELHSDILFFLILISTLVL